MRTVENIASDAHILGDAARLRQVFANLLSNAVKFTGRGGEVVVSSGVVGAEVFISFYERGCGIPPIRLSDIFEPIVQVDESNIRRQGGLGPGLSISREIVELHKGKLRAKSQGEGKGSVFVVKIPVASPHADDGSAPNAKSPGRCRAAEAKTLSSDTPSGGTVLLVDDDSDVLDALANTFAGEEIDAFTATSAERARHILKTNHVDVIFSDISMPDESGYEFIASIRRQDVTVPAVALTAYVRNEDRLRALEAGFDDHIGKPVNPRDLLAVFARLSSRARYRSWPRKKTRVPILT